MKTDEKIAALRGLMEEKGIDVYYVPNGDDHLSDEYVADYFKSKSWLSGFSGDSGAVVVTKDFAGLWTDGRYFTQAEKELAGSCVELMRMAQAGVPDVRDFAVDAVPENGVLGFDGSVISASEAMTLSKRLSAKHARLHTSDDLVGQVWGKKRPKMPEGKLFVLAKRYTGTGAEERIAQTREAMKNAGADVLVLTQLEDPCWLFNVRGDDIACTPVPYAFAMLTAKKAYYYVDRAKLTPQTEAHLKKAGVTVKGYKALASDLAKLRNKTIWTDLAKLNTVLYQALDQSNSVMNRRSPIVMFRAVKNNTEIKNIRNAHVKDGVAMVKFLKWVKEHADQNLNEISAQNHLYALRAEGKDYIEPSFTTICAYRANAAMMHYSATGQDYAEISPDGFLLVDSGGTYKDGTTDITRTIALGALSETEKKYYTMVLKGHLALSRAKFLYGTTGNNLDILARGPMWSMDIDYQCGTGHGVGHVLSVHEGPHGIRWGMNPSRPNAVLEPGMVVTDEPGIYLPGELGIRIENELLVTKGTRNFYGQFLYFEDLTYCPYEREAIVPSLLSDEELAQLNAYHRNVCEVLSPYLEGEELEWLKQACAEIDR